MKKDYFVEILFLIVLVLFGFYSRFADNENLVIKILSPKRIVVDLNNDLQIDSDEIVCIDNIQTFGDSFSDFNDDLKEKFKVSDRDVIVLAYNVRNFAENMLLNKKVKLVKNPSQKNPDCVEGDLLVNNHSYRKTLLENGFAYSDILEFNKDLFDEKIQKAHNLHPIILNRKSNKYHEIDCKYGRTSENYTILLKEDLPDNAIPCKWCNNKHNEVQTPEQNSTFPSKISDGSVVMFLTDLTNNLTVKKDCSTTICKALLSEIQNAKQSIDIATYGWVSVEALDNALKDAVARGVKLRLVYDFTSKKSYYPDTEKIARYASEVKNDLVAGKLSQSDFLMHNKFMVFDNQRVMTGSLNYSKTDLSEFNSNFIMLMNSQQVARIYTEEFEQMLGGKFHREKHKRKKYDNVKLGNTDLQVYFSPQDNAITDHILQYIHNAQKYIYIPAFVITHKKMETALLEAKARGVDVRLIIDATNVMAKKSSVKALRVAGVPVKVENYAGKLHSKSMIIDDEYVIAGSMNFSQSGEGKNDENVLIIQNPRFAKFYREFFQYLWGKIPDKYLTTIPRAESLESIGSCFDGIDNDFDGLIDRLDEGCLMKVKK